MDYFLGMVTGSVIGFGFLFIHYHKSVITNAVIALKNDVADLHAKLDSVTHSLSK